MPKVVKENQDAGAAAPTADDSADKPANDVVNTTPDPNVAPADAGHVNTTGDDGKARRRPLTDSDKQNIFERFNAPDASVQDIADEYDITTEEVFGIADDINSERD